MARHQSEDTDEQMKKLASRDLQGILLYGVPTDRTDQVMKSLLSNILFGIIISLL
jgi:hypothetical protein